MTASNAALANADAAVQIRAGHQSPRRTAARASADHGVRVALVGAPGCNSTGIAATVEADGDLWVAAQVGPAEALETISRCAPDVVVILLAGDDDRAANAAATATIRQISDRIHTPVLAMQPAGGCGGATRMAALVAGAVEVLSHPADPGGSDAEFRAAVRTLQLRGAWVADRRAHPELGQTSLPVLALGASAGGPEALATILGGLGGLAAPVIVSQHLDARFSDRFLDLLGSRSALPVVAATDGASLEPRLVYVAPADHELRVVRGRRLAVEPSSRAGQWPMIDILLGSLADAVGGSGVGVLLTGMGSDGAAGLLRLREAGGLTIAQDADSCDIFGMPRAARDAGAVRHMLPLREIAPAIAAAVNGLANRPYRSRSPWLPAA